MTRIEGLLQKGYEKRRIEELLQIGYEKGLDVAHARGYEGDFAERLANKYSEGFLEGFVKVYEKVKAMTYADWLEADAHLEGRMDRDREMITKKLLKGQTPEWIHEEDDYPMELILEVQAKLKRT